MVGIEDFSGAPSCFATSPSFRLGNIHEKVYVVHTWYLYGIHWLVTRGTADTGLPEHRSMLGGRRSFDAQVVKSEAVPPHEPQRHVMLHGVDKQRYKLGVVLCVYNIVILGLLRRAQPLKSAAAPQCYRQYARLCIGQRKLRAFEIRYIHLYIVTARAAFHRYGYAAASWKACPSYIDALHGCPLFVRDARASARRSFRVGNKIWVVVLYCRVVYVLVTQVYIYSE
ncbi:hypothetical protein BPOR_1110g00060 [Botrytis porri]|uniref:Uncharacterized protein n=1 Tax=Botrytis porri TaxID=87229 RepID=A0A4Z1K6H4_9HELO|nr:hypothetical protein BPOR_1110g00060 [Botrytis porri]